MIAWGCIVWLFGIVIWLFRLLFIRRKRGTYYGYVLKNGRKVFYVGQTKNPKARLAQHVRSADPYGTKKQRHIDRMLHKGKRPTMQIKTKTRDKTKIDAWERKHIRKWGKMNTVGR